MSGYLEYLPYVGAGFLAQLIDGALGMGYGVTSSTLLLGSGLSPLAASASVHASEVATTGMSAFWHFRFGNVDRALFRKLALPGAFGAVAGAALLTTVADQAFLKPVVSVYLLAMGVRIILKGLKKTLPPGPAPRTTVLALGGGFCDAVGGGGWGPIVTATLTGRGLPPHVVIGSVNAAEFFVTACQTATFAAAGGLQHLDVTLALVLGGSISAPLAAYVCRRIPHPSMTVAVGTLNSALSLRTLFGALAKLTAP